MMSTKGRIGIFQSQSDLGMMTGSESPAREQKRNFDRAVMTINRRQLNPKRVAPHIKLIDPGSDDDEEGPELFIAQPTDDIPRNKLVDKLARGLQAFVQRMQKRESYHVSVIRLPMSNWQPAPRECATLTSMNSKAYLLGGLNYDANREVAELRVPGMEYQDVDQLLPEWTNQQLRGNDIVQGRCRHTACAFQQKIISFGGCFMFNKKRQVRECTNQVTVYDAADNRYFVLKTKGLNVLPRKDHCAAVYGQSMIVFGGQFENGQITSEMLNLDLQFNDWGRIFFKQTVDPFVQASCCAVVAPFKKYTSSAGGSEVLRLSDTVMDGIYYFGGKNTAGELQTKLRYLKPHCMDNKVMSADWVKLKQTGLPPCGRVGHAMSYLVSNQALLIVGGRNDEECKKMNTPFLNDIHLFLLDQKSWVSVKYTPFSQRLYRLGNHSMCTLTDGESYEKTFVFGGITHSRLQPSASTAGDLQMQMAAGARPGKKATRSNLNQQASKASLKTDQQTELVLDNEEQQFETSHLSNDLYVLEVRQVL